MYDLDEDEEPLVIDQEQWQQGKPFCVAWVDLDIQYLKVSLICNTVISVATVYDLMHCTLLTAVILFMCTRSGSC